MINIAQKTGAWAIDLVAEAGRMGIFLGQSLAGIARPPLRLTVTVFQIHFLGVNSLVVVIMTAIFSGMVMGLQGFYTLLRFGSQGLLGSGVSYSLITELGPVIAALMVTGRAGSSMTAELGIMRITEQIDALDTMNLEPVKFLASPRILAMLIAMPLLAAISAVVGLVGCHIIAVEVLGVARGVLWEGFIIGVVPRDLLLGLVKSLAFGFTIGWVCSYKGFYANRGAEGVGRATTEAVVTSSVLILVLDYIINAIML